MEVFIGGCVNNPGRYVLRRFATLKEAIKAAKGFRKQFLFFPSGLITIKSQRKWKSESKRKLGNSDYVRKQFNFRENRKILNKEHLFNGEHVVVQFSSHALRQYFGRSKNA